MPAQLGDPQLGDLVSAESSDVPSVEATAMIAEHAS